MNDGVTHSTSLGGATTLSFFSVRLEISLATLYFRAPGVSLGKGNA